MRVTRLLENGELADMKDCLIVGGARPVGRISAAFPGGGYLPFPLIVSEAVPDLLARFEREGKGETRFGLHFNNAAQADDRKVLEDAPLSEAIGRKLEMMAPGAREMA